MQRAVAVVALVMAAGCASSGASVSPGSNPAPRVDVTGNTMSYTLSPEMAVSRDRDIPATVQQAWAALPAVYEKLGLSVTAYDSASHTIVGERLRTRRDFGSRQLRSVVDCGDIAGVPAVDRYEINLKVRTVIERAGQASAIRSMVDATAKPSAVSGELMRCTVKEGVADEVASTLAAMVQS